MATIRREYNDDDIIKAIYAVKPDIDFSDARYIRRIDVEPPTQSPVRVLKVELEIPLTPAEFKRVFADPVG